MLADEAGALPGKERGFAELLGKPGRLPATEQISRLRSESAFDEEVPVVGGYGLVPPRGEKPRVAVLEAHPLAKAVLGEQLIPEVPFPDMGRGVLWLSSEHLRQTPNLLRQRNIVIRAPVGVGVQPGQQGRARGRAYWLRHVGPIENMALLRQPVEIRHLDLFVSVGRQRVKRLLVGVDEQ